MARLRRVVIVAYGSAPLLAKTLAALNPGEQVIVVDNSSSPEVRAIVGGPYVRYIDPGENLGFGGAVNVALREFRQNGLEADVLLLNPDAIVSSDQIDLLQAVFDRSGNGDVGSISPSLAGLDGSPQRVLWPYPSPSSMWREALGLGRFNGTNLEFVVGAVLFLRREALAAVGDFDERYFLYAEEADWQRRAVDLGWRSMLVPEVTARHVGSGTSSDCIRRDNLFHAGQETYIRRWFGPAGWLSYRVAALLGSLLRSVVSTGSCRRSAWARARLYLRGPRRRVAATPPRGPLRVTHVVITGNAAGTERYVSEVATIESEAGHHVIVIGGNEAFMHAALPSAVNWRPGATFRSAASAVRAGGSQDILHTHLTSADLVGVVTKPWHGARMISTRHIAKRRGSSLGNRLVAGLLQGLISQEVCISEHVRGAVGRSAIVLTNGVRADSRRASLANRTVLLAQRLEPEKSTDVALAGWAVSGLVDEGWTFVICGDGSRRESLEQFARERGIRGVQWRGWVDDLRTTMLEATVLLAPAPNEPLGLTVLEAMSVGLPVVAAAGGGHLESAGLCRQALLFPPGDAAECGRQLAALAAMEAQQRVSYGTALKNLQQSKFDVIDHVQRLDEIYRAALRRRTIQ